MKILLTSSALILLGALAIGADGARPASTATPAPATSPASAPANTAAPVPPPVARGSVYQNATGTRLRILMNEELFRGAELEIGEITFAPNTDSGDHVHGAT
jgi:hypothetical protein